MNRWRKILALAILAVCSITQTAAGGQNTANHYRSGNDSAVVITEQKAIAIAQQHFKGRVLAINHDDHTYRIKILSNRGTVHSVLINATDGAVISTH